MKSFRGSLKSPFGYCSLALRLHGESPLEAVQEYFARHYPDLKIIGITDEKLKSEDLLADFWIEHSGRPAPCWNKSGREDQPVYQDRITVDKEI